MESRFFHGGFGMFVLSRTPRQLVEGVEDGVHRPRKVSRLDAEEKNVERSFKGDAGVAVQQLEMLEMIRVAAGQTS
jgi:ribosomal protein L34E